MSLSHAKPTLTVFTDASLFNKDCVAGWGGWARNDTSPKVFDGGPLPYSKHTDVLEAWAMALFLQKLKDTGYFADDKSIILQADNINMLGALLWALPNGHAAKPRDGGVKVTKNSVNDKSEMAVPVQLICDMLKDADVVYLRHVRGHQKGSTTRSYVNEECDKLAKKFAQAQLTGEIERMGAAPVPTVEPKPTVRDMRPSFCSVQFVTMGRVEPLGTYSRSPGAASVIVNGDWGDKREYVSGNTDVTLYEAHIQSVIMALGLANRGDTVQIAVTDKSILEGVGNLKLWRSRNWCKASGEPIKAVEQWQALDKLLTGVNVVWEYVGREVADADVMRLRHLCDEGVAMAVRENALPEAISQ